MKTTIHIFGSVCDIARVCSAIDDNSYTVESFLNCSANEYKEKEARTIFLENIEQRVLALIEPSYSFTRATKTTEKNGRVLVKTGDVFIKVYKKPNGGLKTPELIN